MNTAEQDPNRFDSGRFQVIYDPRDCDLEIILTQYGNENFTFLTQMEALKLRTWLNTLDLNLVKVR